MRERERDVSVLFHFFVYSLVDSCTFSDGD